MFEVLDEKGLMVVAIIPETKVELVIMSAIFVAKKTLARRLHPCEDSSQIYSVNLLKYNDFLLLGLCVPCKLHLRNSHSTLLYWFIY